MGVEMLKAIVLAWLLLFIGDFLSTFLYHIPEHVFGSLHLKTHHSGNKDFRHYAVLALNINVLLDGVLGAIPYIIVGVFLWQFSPSGIICGLILGQLHVWWRHTTALGWQTPKLANSLCQFLFITTPERHWLHHEKTSVGYGDIFTVFEKPAKAWLSWLRLLRINSQRI
jgi:hypothetical protein